MVVCIDQAQRGRTVDPFFPSVLFQSFTAFTVEVLAVVAGPTVANQQQCSSGEKQYAPTV
ncbi:hypothetical protein SAMN04489740_4314 [Arthrobacter alpinus]|uniref:Uncharacterized protein n=1 Tax=Arthrobacter alpinus TaxID=656366 RepID=A0A1H5PGI0_9MICC|nr:hypothetical protein SAMN04489740_4314 [Arthrobacter alpinus]